jgi:hypothetical protein
MARQRIRQVSNADIAAMATEPESVLPELSGSSDKDEAVAAESAKPKVKTVTPEGVDWLNQDPHGLKRAGLYGKKDRFALTYEDLEWHAQFRGAPMGPAELEVIHGADDTAPVDGVTCPICSELVTGFVRTAMVDRETGDLVRDRQTNGIVYRGQFVAVGPDALNLTVHGAHPGECLFRLRLKRDRNGEVVYEPYTDSKGNPRTKPVLLPSQSFDQANARVAGVKASILAKRDARTAEENRVKQNLGFTVGNAAHSSGGRHGDDGIDRGAFAPKTPRGKSRKQRRWAAADEVSE